MFDLDGTLTDSLADLANATNHALTAVGCPVHPTAAYRTLVGDGARVLCERALPSDRLDLVDRALSLMRAHYAQHWSDETRPYAGIVELLAELQRRGLKLAVLSNKPDHFTKQLIAHYFPETKFDAIHGHRESVPLKPDPTAALQIAAELDVPPEQWLYLGDTNTDMQTARAAGMYAVGVLWGFREREELESAGAQRIIDQPSDLLEIM